MRWAAALAVAFLLLLLATACSGGAKEERTYTVRGQIAGLPETPGGEIVLRHEAIDGFVDREGKAVGMDPMSMPFTVAEDVPLTGLAVGDVVEFDLAVDWSRDRIWIRRIRELPPETRLVFRAAKPGGKG